MDMPKTLFEAFDPKLFVQNPMHLAMEVGRIQSWNLIGHEERTNFRLAVLQALTTCGPPLFVQKMEIFLNELKYRRDEFARMMLEYNDDWKRHNIHAQMAAILGQQQPVAALAGPAMAQANTPYILQRPPWTLPRGRPDSTYASDRLAQPEVRKPYETYASDRVVDSGVSNPYEPRAVYARASQALEPPRQAFPYMTLPARDKIPDTEAGPNLRSAKLDSSLFSMDFLTEPTLKAKPLQKFEPEPEPPAEPDTVDIEALIRQAKVEAVREFKTSMVGPGNGFTENIKGRFMKIKAILEENYRVWTEVTGQFAMDQDQDTTMAALLNRFQGMCCEILNENREVGIAAQELVNTVTGAAVVQDDSHVLSSDPDDDQGVKLVDGGSIKDDDEDDQPVLDTLKGIPEVTDKPKVQSKGASLGNKASALSVAKVIRKTKPVNRKPGPAKPKPAPAKPSTAKPSTAKPSTAKPSTAKPSTDPAKPSTDPAQPPTDGLMLEASGAGTEW
jgi:hypothetical protein